MTLEFLIKIIMAVGLCYYSQSRFLYAYEINGACTIPFTIDINKVIKNKFCKIIFPREFKNYNESLYGTSRISVVGLCHCMVFYFPVQLAYFSSFIIGLFNEQMANKIAVIAFNIMLLGFAVFLVSILLSVLVNNIRKRRFENRRKQK